MLSHCDELKKSIDTGLLDSSFTTLYGHEKIAVQKKRYLQLLAELATEKPNSQVVFVNAPGRTELGGNHTDHNHGCVLAAAVDLDCVAAVTPLESSEVILYSKEFPSPIKVDLDDLTPRPREHGTPEGLIRGVAAGIAKRKGYCRGFYGRIHATCKPGTGLSSSAAFSLLIGEAFNVLHHNNDLSAQELALLAREAENVFFGKPCGLMDQMASAIGQTIFVDFYHPENPIVEQINHSLDGSGYTLAIIDTGGCHTNLTPEYAAIPEEMQRAAQALGKPFARDISKEMFFANIATIRNIAGDRASLRLLHFIEENLRAQTMANSLKNGDIPQYLQGVADSGTSSCGLLQNCASSTNSRKQGILLALALSKRICPNALCRVHGGGFAGTVQTYIPNDQFTKYCQAMGDVFGTSAIMPVRIGRPGVCMLSSKGLIVAEKR